MYQKHAKLSFIGFIGILITLMAMLLTQPALSQNTIVYKAITAQEGKYNPVAEKWNWKTANDVSIPISIGPEKIKIMVSEPITLLIYSTEKLDQTINTSKWYMKAIDNEGYEVGIVELIPINKDYAHILIITYGDPNNMVGVKYELTDL